MAHKYKQAADLTATDINVSLGTFWQDIRYEYDAGNLIYAGKHYKHDADTADTKWEIWKYTYDATPDIIRLEGPLVGAWDDRASLTWGA